MADKHPVLLNEIGKGRIQMPRIDYNAPYAWGGVIALGRHVADASSASALRLDVAGDIFSEGGSAMTSGRCATPA